MGEGSPEILFNYRRVVCIRPTCQNQHLGRAVGEKDKLDTREPRLARFMLLQKEKDNKQTKRFMLIRPSWRNSLRDEIPNL